MVERMSDRPTHTLRLPRFWPSRAYYGWAIVFTSFFISVAQVPMYGPVFSIFLKPIEESLGWSRSTITIGFTIGSLGGALLAAVVGPIVDRYGARIVVAVTGLIVTAGLLGVAAISEPWHLWLAYGAARTASVAGVGLGTTVAIANCSSACGGAPSRYARLGSGRVSPWCRCSFCRCCCSSAGGNRSSFSRSLRCCSSRRRRCCSSGAGRRIMACCRMETPRRRIPPASLSVPPNIHGCCGKYGRHERCG